MITQEQFDALKAENAALKAKAAPKVLPLRLKVSEKKALSLYGLSARFPTTLYVQQWERLIAHVPEIEAFIAANKGQLATKE